MTARQLIAELKKLPPDEDVTIYHSESGTYCDILEVCPASDEFNVEGDYGLAPAYLIGDLI